MAEKGSVGPKVGVLSRKYRDRTTVVVVLNFNGYSTTDLEVQTTGETDLTEGRGKTDRFKVRFQIKCRENTTKGGGGAIFLLGFCHITKDPTKKCCLTWIVRVFGHPRFELKIL